MLIGILSITVFLVGFAMVVVGTAMWIADRAGIISGVRIPTDYAVTALWYLTASILMLFAFLLRLGSDILTLSWPS